MIPLVLVKSFGCEKSAEIIKGILTSNGDMYDTLKLKFGNHDITTYKVDIITKYYKTQIALFVCEDITSVPDAVLASVEGAIFYFDPDDKTFSRELDGIHTFIKTNNIDASYLISRNICESSVIYEKIKRTCTPQCVVIDLNDQTDEECMDYSEVLELLKNYIWSNVNVPSFSNSKHSGCAEADEAGYISHLEDDDIEKQLNDFEDLLNNIQSFKVVSQNLKREDVLNSAEKLAEHFAKILNED